MKSQNKSEENSVKSANLHVQPHRADRYLQLIAKEGYSLLTFIRQTGSLDTLLNRN